MSLSIARSCARPGFWGIGKLGKAVATSPTISPTVSSESRSCSGRESRPASERFIPRVVVAASADNANESSSACCGVSSSKVSANHWTAAGSRSKTDPFATIAPSGWPVDTRRVLRSLTLSLPAWPIVQTRRAATSGHRCQQTRPPCRTSIRAASRATPLALSRRSRSRGVSVTSGGKFRRVRHCAAIRGALEPV